MLANHHEIADNYSFDFVAEVAAPWLRWPFPSWGLLLPFALCGAWFARRERAAWLLFAFAASYAASLVLFFNLSRLRLPLAPLVILFAAAGGVELFRRLRRRDWRALAAALLFLLLAYPVVYADVVVDRTSIRHYNLAQRHMAVSFQLQRDAVELSKRGDERGARTRYAEAMGEREQAEEAYLRGLAESPGNRRLEHGLRDLWIVRVTNLGRLGRNAEALAVAERIARRYPDHAPGHAWLATLHAAEGHPAAARAAARRALELDPDEPRAQRVLEQLGESE